MSAILLKVFSVVMSVLVTLSGTFPALFGNRVFSDPVYGSLVDDGTLLNVGFLEEAIIISDYETAKNLFNEDQTGELNEKYFEKGNIIMFSVTIPNSSCKVFVNSIAECGDTVEIGYSLVRDRCVGATVISRVTVCVAVSKNIENVKLDETEVFVPFCIHK